MTKLLVALAALTSMIVIMIVSAIASNTGVFVGPKADVAGVEAADRELAPNDKIRKVYVVGDYALLGRYTLPEGTGSRRAFKRISGERWKLIFSAQRERARSTWDTGIGRTPAVLGISPRLYVPLSPLEGSLSCCRCSGAS